jgi:hypothetical protein
MIFCYFRVFERPVAAVTYDHKCTDLNNTDSFSCSSEGLKSTLDQQDCVPYGSSGEDPLL